MNKKVFISLALILGICVSFAGCSNKGPGSELIEREEETEFVATPDVDPSSELLQKYNSHKENAPLAFKSNTENPATDFEYSLLDNGVAITKYIGSGDIVMIPEKIEGKDVVRITATSFADSGVRAVYIPDSVCAIEKGAFENCLNLSTLRVPFIGDGEGETNGGVIFGADDIISNGIKVPGSLKMLIIGEGEVEISSNSLSYFKNLEAVILPSSVLKIGRFAFNECRSLVYVDFGGAKLIEEYAFLACDSLIYLDIPDTVMNIRLGAFMQCDQLKYISLPFVGGSETENRYIGYIFGAESKAWNNSFVPMTLSYVNIRGAGVPDMAFEGCTNLIDVTLAEGVSFIGERAFSNCKSMQSVTVADSVESIGACAFSNCYTLDRVEISSGSRLRSVGIQAFMNCKALRSISFPSAVGTLDSGIFLGCDGELTVNGEKIN